MYCSTTVSNTLVVSYVFDCPGRKDLSSVLLLVCTLGLQKGIFSLTKFRCYFPKKSLSTFVILSYLPSTQHEHRSCHLPVGALDSLNHTPKPAQFSFLMVNKNNVLLGVILFLKLFFPCYCPNS